MPKIEITEIDETTPGVAAESYDVVFIPGLVDTNQPSLYANGEYIGLNVDEPTLFTSVAQFEAKCGTKPYQFTENYTYGSIGDGYAAGAGFNSLTNSSDIMFAKGSYDPSYIMAKELLNQGLTVLYLNMNPQKIGQYTKSNPNGNVFIPSNYYAYTIIPINEIGEAGKEIPGNPIYPSNDPTSNYYYQNILQNGNWNTAVFPDGVYSVTFTGYVDKSNWVAQPTITPQDVYSKLETIYNPNNTNILIDKGSYSIKYVTSGGYPTFTYHALNDDGSQGTIYALVNNMLEFAYKRGDCVALIDHPDIYNGVLNPNTTNGLYDKVTSYFTTNSLHQEFGSMFTPWATYSRTTIDVDNDNDAFKSTTSIRLPASYAYLSSLADSIKTNANFLAVAGVTRGKVLHLATKSMNSIITNGAADTMQPRQGVAINAITNIRPYGYCIWGNRTLKNNEENLVATSFLNIRNLVSDVKKLVYQVSKRLTFEQNNDILWINFNNQITPTLDRMVAGYGISSYRLIRDITHPKYKEKATLCAKVILRPVYAVEDFYITVVLKDDEVTVE